MHSLLSNVSLFFCFFLLNTCANYQQKEFKINTNNEENCKIEIISKIDKESSDNIQILKCSEKDILLNLKEGLDESCQKYFFDIYDSDANGYIKKTGITCYKEDEGWEIIY